MRLRLLARLERKIGGYGAGSAGFIYSLDTGGQRLVQHDRSYYQRPWTPSAGFLDHFLGVTELYVRLIEADRTRDVELLTFAPEPTCWRSFIGRGGGRAVLKPDAFVKLGMGEYEDHYFVEVDRATESVAALTRKLAAYRTYWQSGKEQARSEIFPRVLWLVPSEKRQATLTDLIATQPAESRVLFQVALFDTAVPVFRGEILE